MVKKRQIYLFLLQIVLSVVCDAAKNQSKRNSARLQDLNYVQYPRRKNNEAAVVEWGNSAVISALEAAVAGFGPQTSRGAYFEVETSIVLSKPIDGNIEGNKLENADEIMGNMVVMTNAANLSGVKMAEIAQKSGAAALMVVNVLDSDTPDYIYSLQPEDDSEAQWAEENIEIPVIMVSLSSGNVLTSAQDPQINNGMPERVRLYGGGDRPFFEDASSSEPMVYLIHNLLLDEECESLIQAGTGKTELIDDSVSNLLEGTPASTKSMGKSSGVERTYLWKGQLKGQQGKDIDERMEQVTGYPKDHFSDFQLNQFSGSDNAMIGPHYDELPESSLAQMATITIFLNDVEEGSGGEIVFPSANPPIKIRPKKGMAIVHHNLNQENALDPSSIHADLPYITKGISSDNKWTAKRWVYLDPVSPARRTILPILCMPFGGKLPNAIKNLHTKFIGKFGTSKGEVFFDKFLTLAPVVLLLAVANLINAYFNSTLKSKKKESSSKSKKTKKKKSASKKTKSSEKAD